MKYAEDKPSKENHGARTSSSWSPVQTVPGPDQLREAAAVLNAGKKIAVLAGQGALNARKELEEIAERLGAPVAKALLGKAVLPDDSPYTTGGIGHLGTQPSHWAMQNCDTVLILGSTMPWIDSYPKPGQARGVQVDINADRIGLRYPTEIGLVGDVRATLQGLIPLIQRKSDRAFLTQAQSRMRDWFSLLDRIEQTGRSPLRPQMVVRAVSDLIAPDAVISLDCGANTFFAARHLRIKAGQRLTSPGAGDNGSRFALRDRSAVRLSEQAEHSDRRGRRLRHAYGGTKYGVQHRLPIKIIVLKNNSLSEVRFEQKDLGYPNYGCGLPPIDFVAFAKACGADGGCANPGEVRPAIEAALRSPRAALVEAVVDPDEAPLKPEELKS
jgi:pyruvate dehydrogenase (quinone)